MNSVGERLRLERLRQGRDISDIAAQTRISSRYIEAIEADDLRSLPGGFFYRSFVRQYAGVLGIDEAEVDQDLEALLGPPEDNYAAPPRPTDPIEVPPMPAAHRSEATRQIPMSLVLLIAAIIGASGLYSLWQRSRNTAEPVPEPAPVSVPKTQAPPVVSPPPVSAPPAAQAPVQQQVPPPQQAAPATSIPTASTTPPPPAATPAGAIGMVHLVATGEVWIRLSSGGKNLVERILKPGEDRSVPLSGPGVMRVGDAANLQVWWNGKPVGPLGPAGQLRDVFFAVDGVRVAPPPRPDSETNPNSPRPPAATAPPTGL